MACYWAFKKGAKRVIGIDNNWRTEYAKSKIPGLETINYLELKKQTVTQKLLEMVPGGVDACIEASGGEYAKSWYQKVEMALSLAQDTCEMINECITATRKFGRVGIIGDYTGCEVIRLQAPDGINMLQTRITSTSVLSWRRVFV
jgi:threonine dehydrogenase-like Zn-dependent dehydrogenase